MISILNPQLDPMYSDTWGEFLPFAMQTWIPILEAGCFVPRWVQCPIGSLSRMAAAEYNSWSLQLPAGSFIMEIMHVFNAANPDTTDPVTGKFAVQITDTALDYIWFSQPLPDTLFYKYDNTGRNGHVLPKPYPVLSPGVFQIERWCSAAGLCELLLAVAVPENVA